MALTYDESAQLANDTTFRGRVKMACLHFAQYISGEAPNVPAHNTRFRWAQQTYQAPDQMAGQIISAVVMDAQVVADGSAITDANLQTAVEMAIQNFL